MKLPFADLLTKTRARLTPPAPPGKAANTPLPTAKKSESEKLAKTVMPSLARVAAGEAETESSAIVREVPPPPPSSSESVLTENARAPAPPPPKISMGAGAPASLPPAVALALAPNVERAISMPLEDVIAQMPEGYLKPRESIDATRQVLLKAAEVEKGMATGRPAIPVTALFQQAPDIFMHTVPSSDGAMVALPFERVMNALSNMTVRSDQTAERAVPQVETPFLQVTMEDTKRFGTPVPVAPAVVSEQEELPPVRIEPATAEALAAAVPEATDAFAAPPHVPEPAMAPASPARIAFARADDMARAGTGGNKFGTGEPAIPRVPASSGPPVPPFSPARIAFNFPPPSSEAAKWAQAGDSPAEVASARAPEPSLNLALRPILELLPPMQLGGDPGAVASGATVSFPMSMIAPQLASGKVVVPPRAFYAALPEEYRKLFLPDAVNAPVQLPLPDVLANLPGEGLRIRDDQEVHAPAEVFDTPFAAKAAEDAARLGTKSDAFPPTVPTVTMPTLTRERPSAPSLHRLPQTETSSAPKFSAKEAVAKACALPGVNACSVIFADGLGIAGNIPASVNADGLSAVAPTLLQKLDKHMLQTSLGPLLGMTVHGGKASVSFFGAGDVCLTALHSGVELPAESRGELGRITEELSLAYSAAEQTNE